MVDGTEAFTVTGILKDIPENSHMKFDMLFPIKSLPKYQNGDNEMWVGSGRDVASHTSNWPMEPIPLH